MRVRMRVMCVWMSVNVVLMGVDVRRRRHRRKGRDVMMRVLMRYVSAMRRRC